MVRRPEPTWQEEEEIAAYSIMVLKEHIDSTCEGEPGIREDILESRNDNLDGQYLELSIRLSWLYRHEKKCINPNCQWANEDGNAMVADFGSGHDIDGLAYACVLCAPYMPRINRLHGRDLEKYVKYARHVKAQMEKKGDKYGDWFHAIKQWVPGGYVPYGTESNARMAERLRNLEFGCKECPDPLHDGGRLEFVSEFHNDSSKPDGLQRSCRKCVGKRAMKRTSEVEREERERIEAERRASVLREYEGKKYIPCGGCGRTLDSSKYPLGRNGAPLVKKCSDCRSSRQRRKLLEGERGRLKDNHRIHRMFGSVMSSKSINRFFHSYAIDVERGVFVHRHVFSKGQLLRAPGDEAYRISPQYDKEILFGVPGGHMKCKDLMSILCGLTHPNGTIVTVNGCRTDSRPGNIAQWSVEDPDDPKLYRIDIPRKRKECWNEVLQDHNQALVKSLRSGGEIPAGTKWYRSTTTRSNLETSPYIELPGGLESRGQLRDFLDSARRGKAVAKYIRECDEKYLELIGKRMAAIEDRRIGRYYDWRARLDVKADAKFLHQKITEAIGRATLKK